jgi:flavin reductase (DIM6/NTAB) family NADH-FMN oxidoreductase RutF
MELDAQTFKDTMARFPCGVTVVTAMGDDGVPSGLTVSTFAAVSLQPPRISICVGHESDSLPVIERAGHFAVHILGREQAELGLRFAKLLPDVPEPFAGLSYSVGVTGSPLLPHCTTVLECRIEQRIVVADHTLFIGAPLKAAEGSLADDPIVYHARSWRRLTDR